MLRQTFALGLGEFFQFFFGHRFVHFFRCANQLADLDLAALRRQCGTGGFLLGMRISRQEIFTFAPPKANVPAENRFQLSLFAVKTGTRAAQSRAVRDRPLSQTVDRPRQRMTELRQRIFHFRR